MGKFEVEEIIKMASEQLMSPASGGGGRYFQMQPEQIPSMVSSLFSFAPAPTQESNRIFEELPKAVIVSVSRPDAGDISPVLLSYTIECQYKQASPHLFVSIFRR